MGYLDVAAGEVGYDETPVNITKYWTDLNPGLQGQPWCFAFVSWCLKQSGQLGAIGGSPIYYCPTGVAKARALGQWFNEPVVGALVFFSFGGNTAVHIEFVESVHSGYITTVGGNTGNGGVRRQNRSSGILGYWHIDGSAGGGTYTVGPGIRVGALGTPPVQTITGAQLEESAVRFTRGR